MGTLAKYICVFVSVIHGVCFLAFGYKRVLVIDPSDNDVSALMHPARQHAYQYVWYYIPDEVYTDDACRIYDILSDILDTYAGHIDGVISTRDYLGTILAALVAQRCHLPGPSVQSVITLQHKYLSRMLQRQCVPYNTPDVRLVDPYHMRNPPSTFPCFVKPAKAYFSFGANMISSYQELVQRRFDMIPVHTFLQPYNDVLAAYGYSIGSDYLVAESILSGAQVTCEGCVRNGEFTFFGITDAVMYPGTIAFQRFVYPTSLSESVQQRIYDVSQRVIRASGFNDGVFNIEFTYNSATDQLAIIEVNPRSSPQFADFYEKVHGFHTYDIILAIATGDHIPYETHTTGRYTCAASFALRTFEDQYVVRTPTHREMKRLRTQFPDSIINIHARRGWYLSDELQDGNSFLYMTVNLGGDGMDDLMQRYAACKRRIPIRLSSAA